MTVTSALRRFKICLALLCLWSPRLRADEKAWVWFNACADTNIVFEVRLDKTLVPTQSVPVCHTARGSKGGDQHITFVLNPRRPIIWEGYRSKEVSPARHPIKGDFWQAGREPDALIIGVSFIDGQKILMNTLCVVLPARGQDCEIAKGLVLRTYPISALPLSEPEAPVEAIDFLLRTVLSDLLCERHEGFDPERPLIVAKNGPLITPKILPAESKPGFVLLAPDEITALPRASRVYVTLNVKWQSEGVADVAIFGLPIGPGPYLCCWELVKRYQRTETGWRFVKLVGGGII